MSYILTEEERKILDEEMEKDLLENGRYFCWHCGKQYKEKTAIENVCEDCLKARYVSHGAEPNGCAFCEHLIYDSESDDMGYPITSWFECEENKQYEYLKSFPFKNTPKKCIEKGCFKQRESKHLAINN
jgi:hypothetical protein